MATQCVLRSCGRLHFGLMEICPGQPHCFGGVGLMIDGSVASLGFEEGWCSLDSLQFQIEDPHRRERIQAAIRRWMDCNQLTSCPVTTICSESFPEPHQGLGSGTQIACSIATLLEYARQSLDGNTNPNAISVDASRVWGTSDYPIDRLAITTGRGRRSNIGLTGFLTGGFVVDLGKNDIGSELVPRTSSVPFPSQWRLILAREAHWQGDSGDAESRMFDQCSNRPNPNLERMLQLIDQQLLPALRAEDWSAASAAIAEYGSLAGEVFRPVQGGIYRTEQISRSVRSLQELGIPGSGQSSWGPTVFGLAHDEDQAHEIARLLRHRQPGLRIDVVAARNRGAIIQRR